MADIHSFSTKGNRYDTSSFSVQMQDEYIAALEGENILLTRRFDSKAVHSINIRAWDIEVVINLLQTLQSHIESDSDLDATIRALQLWKVPDDAAS